MERALELPLSRSDRELLVAAKEGDYSSFEALVRRYHARIYRLALGMTKDRHEAEEVVQDTFLRIHRGLRSFRQDSSPGSWIFRIAANSALMSLRAKRRKPQLSLEELPCEESSARRAPLWPSGDWMRQPEEKLLEKEVTSRMEAAIAELPQKYRLVLLLRDVEGLSNDEVAQTLGLTLPTVKARLHRSRMFVRDALNRYFGEKNGDA